MYLLLLLCDILVLVQQHWCLDLERPEKNVNKELLNKLKEKTTGSTNSLSQFSEVCRTSPECSSKDLVFTWRVLPWAWGRKGDHLQTFQGGSGLVQLLQKGPAVLG